MATLTDKSLLLAVVFFTGFCLAQSSAEAPDDPAQRLATPQQDATPSTEQDARDRIYYPGDTERIVPLGKKLGANLLLDQKEIWTSPFRVNRHNAVWWAVFGGAAATLIATDHHTIKTFENSPSQIRWGNNVSNIGGAYTLIPLAAGFYGVGAIWDNPQARETGVLGAEAMLDCLVVVTALKYATGRVRPDSTTGERGQFFDGGDSFPSGHTIITWAFASVIAHEYKNHGGKWVPFVAYGLATAVSGARFAAQRHFASDIVAGAGMGWFIGRYVYQTHEDHAAHHHAWAHPQLVPSVEPGTAHCYAATLRFGK